MLSRIKFFTYIDEEEIINFIDIKYDHYSKYCCETNDIGKYIINDDKYIGLIKFEFSKFLLDNKLDIQTIMKQIIYFLDTFKCYETIELFFIFSNEYIRKNNLAHEFFNFLFYTFYAKILDFGCSWINNKNNQIKLVNMLGLIQYWLFGKYKHINTFEINVNRRNFAIFLFELLNENYFLYKNDVQIILNKSIKHNQFHNYELFVFQLRGLYYSRNNYNNNEFEADFFCEKWIYESDEPFNRRIISY